MKLDVRYLFIGIAMIIIGFLNYIILIHNYFSTIFLLRVVVSIIMIFPLVALLIVELRRHNIIFHESH